MGKELFLKTATIFSIVLLLSTLLLNRIFLKEFFPHELQMDLRSAAIIAGASALLIGFMYLLISHDRVIIPEILNRLRELQGVLLELTPGEKIYLSFVAGVSEELLFRGLLQPLLGIGPASVLFGIMHFITPGYVLLAGAMGFYLGFLFEWTGNIVVPVMVHGLYNVFAFSMLSRIYLSEKTDRGHHSSSR